MLAALLLLAECPLPRGSSPRSGLHQGNSCHGATLCTHPLTSTHDGGTDLLYKSGMRGAGAPQVRTDPARQGAKPVKGQFQVWMPSVQRAFVVDADAENATLLYNHDSSIARFDSRWFVVWNGNTIAREGQPGQANLVSTTTDPNGVSGWSDPVAAFSSPFSSDNPVPCDPTSCIQWQPNLIVLELNGTAELAASWTDAAKSFRWSTLAQGARALWHNTVATFPGGAENGTLPVIDGKTWRIFPSQNPTRLRNGRILAPIVLIDASGKPSPDAPPGLPPVLAVEKRCAVVFSDDGGSTWGASPGSTQPNKSWAQWEPTVVEQPDGSVLMLCRDNDYRDEAAGGPLPWQRLLAATSTDSGTTWTPLVAVPVATVVSRMHVLPLPVTLGAPSRFLMTDNDWWFGGFVRDRLNAAVYFSLGGGTQLVAAGGYSAPGEMAAYPQMALDTTVSPPALMVSYSSGNSPRSIKVARIDGLPDGHLRYVYPRSDLPPSPAPTVRHALWLSFMGSQWLLSRSSPQLVGNVSFAAWVRVEEQTSHAVVVDNRDSSGGGGVFGIDKMAPYVFVPCAVGNIGAPTLRAQTYAWSYVGANVAVAGGRVAVTFVVDGRSETRAGGVLGNFNGWTGSTASVGAKRNADSMLPGFSGDLRFLGVWSNTVLSVAQHNFVANLFGESIGVPRMEPAAPTPAVTPPLWLDPSKSSKMNGSFAFPAGQGNFAGPVKLANGSTALRVCGLGSAGLEVPALDHPVCGGQMTAGFNARLVLASLDTDGADANGALTLATVGDAASSARLVVDLPRGSAQLTSNASQTPITVAPPGTLQLDTWYSYTLFVNSTHAGVSILGSSTAAMIEHGASTADVWTYFGNGFYANASGKAVGCGDIDMATLYTSC